MTIIIINKDNDKDNNIDNMVLRIVWEQIQYWHYSKHSIYVTIIILLFIREINKGNLPVQNNLLTKPKVLLCV